MELIALLPMKAHSERVPGKNFKIFKGRPLFEWTLLSLIEIREITKIVINTDDVEAFKEYKTSQHPKVNLRNRPMDIRGDFVSMNKIIEYDLICETESDNFIMTHSTNPLISTGTFKRAIKKYEESTLKGFDSLFSVNKFQSRFYTEKLEPLNHDPANLIRTQDLGPIYEENSCFYLFKRDSFKKTRARIGSKPQIMETPILESVDIDDMDSWKQAESNFEILKNYE